MKIYDGRNEFYQWDLDQKLIVNDPDITEVHYCNQTDDCSLVCEVYEEDGQRLVNVPNILLQEAFPIRAYAYAGCCTKQSVVFTVKHRSKPADYVYTETEVRRWDEFYKRLDELELGARAIIDVEELPTKDINEALLYRTHEGVYSYDGVWRRVVNEGDLKSMKADIEKKQDTISFDGEYDAEVNKAATVETVIRKVAEIVANAPEDFDTLKEFADWLTTHGGEAAEMNSAIKQNADAIAGVIGSLADYVKIVSDVKRLYCTDHNGNQTTIGYHNGMVASGIVQRNPDGSVQVPDTTGDVHAVNYGSMKRYVDGYVKQTDYVPNNNSLPSGMDTNTAIGKAYIRDYLNNENTMLIAKMAMSNSIPFRDGYGNFRVRNCNVDGEFCVNRNYVHGLPDNLVLDETTQPKWQKWLGMPHISVEAEYSWSNTSYTINDPYTIFSGFSGPTSARVGLATTDILSLDDIGVCEIFGGDTSYGYLSEASVNELTGAYYFQTTDGAIVLVVTDLSKFNNTYNQTLPSNGTYLCFIEYDRQSPNSTMYSYSITVSKLRKYQVTKCDNKLLDLENNAVIKALLARIEALENKA